MNKSKSKSKSKSKEAPMRIDAKWTDDCQGKKDFDGTIVEISTRYWPRGGGFAIFHRGGDDIRFEGNDTRQHIRPSAKATILLRERDGDSIELAALEVEGDTEAEVKAAVERWADEQYGKILDALKALGSGH